MQHYHFDSFSQPMQQTKYGSDDPLDLLGEKILPAWISKPPAHMSPKDKLQFIMDQVMPGVIGLKVQFAGKTEVRGSLDLDKRTLNVVNSMHGGAIFTLGDTLAGILLWINTDGGLFGTTKSASIQYFRPLRQGTLYCTVTETARHCPPENPSTPGEVEISALLTDGSSHKIATMKMVFSMHRFKHKS